MDFLDPKKRRKHAIMLMVGYVLIAIALVIGTIVLFEQAYGFGLGKNGKVVQSGLVFVGTTPSGAQIRLNGVLNKAQSNARLSLVSGSYHISLDRAGYRSWQQNFNLLGGDIQRLDYTFLFPIKLTTTPVKTYTAPIGLATQSPDRRWLLVQLPGSDTQFDLYDRKDLKAGPTVIKIPENLLTTGDSNSWALDEWSNDNQHVLLTHVHDGKSEYILLDRNDPAKTLNLSTTLGVTPTKISLIDKKYDQYYLFDATAQTLHKATLGDPTPVHYLSNVLDYKSYGSDVVLYASSKTATDGKTAMVLRDGDKSYLLREVSASPSYMLNITRYSGDWYAAIGAASENKTYVYKNPQSQLNSTLGQLVPVSVLKTAGPTFNDFSANTRFIMEENGSRFSVYDAEEDKSYEYDSRLPLDAPQPHATWMDGHRITYVSGGKLVVFDFDGTNKQTLMSASPAYNLFFQQDYKRVDILEAPTANGQVLTMTPLRVTADL